MTFKVKVSADIKKTKRSLSRLQRTVLPAAINGALNKTAKKVQTVAVKSLAKTIGLTNKEIKTFCRKQQKAKYDLFAKVSVKGDDRCPLFGFLATYPKTHRCGDIDRSFVGGSVA